MSDNSTVARPYAQAVFELAHEGGTLESWSQSLATAAALLADGQVDEYLGDPAFSKKQRLDFLLGLFGAAGDELLGGKDPRGTNFLRLLVENGRVSVLPDIAGHFEVLKADIENRVDVLVSSATELTAEQREAIAASLRSRLGRDVRIETEIDENLIGGAVIRAGGIVIDGSMRARLEGLANALVK